VKSHASLDSLEHKHTNTVKSHWTSGEPHTVCGPPTAMARARHPQLQATLMALYKNTLPHFRLNLHTLQPKPASSLPAGPLHLLAVIQPALPPRHRTRKPGPLHAASQA